MESNSVCNHASDKQNRTTAKRESDLLITSMITVLFSFASLSRIENISIISRRDKKTQQVVEGAASNDRVYLQKSEPGLTEYKLQAKEYK